MAHLPGILDFRFKPKFGHPKSTTHTVCVALSERCLCTGKVSRSPTAYLHQKKKVLDLTVLPGSAKLKNK